MADLKINIGLLELKNPVMPASGTFGWGEEMEPYVDISKLGAIVPKSITVGPTEGNPPPRTAETPCGMINSIGLQNPGVNAFLDRYMPKLRSYGVPVIVSIAGFAVDEYRQLAEVLEGTEGVSAIEVNISCPNVKEGGIAFGTKINSVTEIVGEVKNATTLPVIPKLTPNVENLVPIAHAAEQAGADALTVANTLKGMAVDWKERKPLIANVVGGLSGPAIKPHALYLVREVSRAVKIPVIASGGIMSAADVLEFIVCGATAVQIGTANLVDPATCGRLPGEIDKLLDEAGIEKLSELTGTLRE